MTKPPVSPEILERDILEVLSWWMLPSRLATQAKERNRIGNDGYGIDFPESLDEYDREVLGLHIPEGHVEVYGFDRDPELGFSHIIPETVFLTVLAKYLKDGGRTEDAQSVEDLIASRGS